MIEELGNVLTRAELLAAYRGADQFVGDDASQSELESLRACRRIVMDKLEQATSLKEELIGGTLEEEVHHFEARLILRALEQHKGSVTSAARELGVNHQRLSKLLHGRHRTLALAGKKAVCRNN